MLRMDWNCCAFVVNVRRLIMLRWIMVSFVASDSCEGLVSGCSPTSGSPGRGHERSLSDGGQTTVPRDNVDRVGERRLASTAVKNIISTFWSSSANLLVEVSILIMCGCFHEFMNHEVVHNEFFSQMVMFLL